MEIIAQFAIYLGVLLSISNVTKVQSQSTAEDGDKIYRRPQSKTKVKDEVPTSVGTRTVDSNSLYQSAGNSSFNVDKFMKQNVVDRKEKKSRMEVNKKKKQYKDKSGREDYGEDDLAYLRVFS